MAPVCTSWSSLSNVLPEAERLRRRAAAYPFVEFRAEVATFQHGLKRYFIIENPESSHMWGTEPMSAVLQLHDVHRSTIHMCAYGLKGPVSNMPIP